MKKDKSELALAMERYEMWRTSPIIDFDTVKELEELRGDILSICDRFGSELEFGTAGLRGVMRAGTNAMNIYVIMRATQGFADYINEYGQYHSKSEKCVVIAFDSRNNSKLFAEKAACVMAANGIKVKMFKTLRPTPEVSFSIRRYNAIAGINLTASHNPKQYNGYKAYWDDGTQLSVDQAKMVSSFIDDVDLFNDIKICDLSAAVKDGRIELLGPEADDAYINAVMGEIIDTSILKNTDLCVVHTPLHGASYKIVPDVLRTAGIRRLYSVEEQLLPDGNFPTAARPNPELNDVYTLPKELASKVGADIIIANDPDSDRIGVMVNHKGSYRRLTGNQVGALILEYVLSHYNKKEGESLYAIKTIVTTELAARICENYGAELVNCLTGFKNIGEIISYYSENAPEKRYMLGFEESYGYLIGTYARDKDGVVAALIISEMAAGYKKEGMTLIDVLDGLYEKYGYYAEETVNLEFTGFDANERRESLMTRLRECPPEEIFGLKVEAIDDYLNDGITNSATGLAMYENVLYYHLEGGNIAVVRPSGTEPKIKVYFLLNGDRSFITGIFAPGGESAKLSEKWRALAYGG